jgi:hypothetical protein
LSPILLTLRILCPPLELCPLLALCDQLPLKLSSPLCSLRVLRLKTLDVIPEFDRLVLTLDPDELVFININNRWFSWRLV